MKRLWAAVAVLILLLASAILTGRWTQSVTEDLIVQLQSAQELTREDDWEQALEITEQVMQKWQSQNLPLHALLRHTETDEIWLSLQAVIEYLKLQEMDQYAAANAQLVTQLELLAEMERPSLENVL